VKWLYQWLYHWWLWLTMPAALVVWLGSSKKPVPLLVASARAQMCLTCPNHVRLGKVAEKAASELQRWSVMRHRMGLNVPDIEKLHFCSPCGCFLPLKIWVQYKHLKQWEREDVAEKIREKMPGCWQL
jgi:hypothetical protein